MRVHKRIMMSAIFTLALSSLSLVAFAQDAPPPPNKSAGKPGDVVIFEREIAGPQGTGIRMAGPQQGPPLGDDTIVFVSSEMSFDGKPVKGAPYSAQATTETTRTLSDGNRIKRKNTASVYRDGEGRTRRDQELEAVGPWAVPGEPQQTIFINDPVAGANYVLDPRTHTARKMAPVFFRVGPPPSDSSSAPAPGTQPKVSVRVESDVFNAPVPPPLSAGIEGGMNQEFHIAANPNKGTTESLGKQTIEGVMAEGTRTTMTIPAGQFGNEQPIQIVSENWYSPELQTVVMSKHSDPFVGETIYRLTNIVRGEPSRTLFEVPADYTIKEAPIHTRVMKRRSSDEK